MKTILKTTLVLSTLLLVAGTLTSPADAQNSPIVMQITGGSTGRFIPTPHSLNTSGSSEFTVNVRIRQDGTASGQFVCAVANAVVISGQASNANIHPDGSVTITGVGYGYFYGVGGFEGDSFTVTFRAGGPGVGGFDFADSGFPAGFYDTEGVVFGAINIAQ